MINYAPSAGKPKPEPAPPRRIHLACEEERRTERFGNHLVTITKRRSLCGRRMFEDGQFTAFNNEVTCAHCLSAIERIGPEPTDDAETV